MIRYKFNTLFILFFLAACMKESTQNSYKTLVWQDEFNYTGLPDNAKWGYEIGLIRNDEAQYYREANINNTSVDGEHLIITAQQEAFSKADYTSASIHTALTHTFTYGRVEVRAKLPNGKGTWPAVWMLGANIQTVGWPQCGELDIMENVGFEPERIHANIHTESYNHTKGTGKGKSIVVDNPEDFHVYTMDWYPSYIRFYVDDIPYFTFHKEASASINEWPYDLPHYLIINLAIGGSWGGQQGIDDSKFPHQFIIDYVRVYK